MCQEILLKKHVDLLLIKEKSKKHYVLIKDFDTFMYDYTLHRSRKQFCHYCLQALSTEKILKSHINDWFKINGNQMIGMSKESEYVRFKNYERKRKSPFMIHADFENILVPEDNEKQNPEESYTNKYQKYVVCSFGYELVCVDDKFSKSFKSYLGEDAVYNFINSTIEESRN